MLNCAICGMQIPADFFVDGRASVVRGKSLCASCQRHAPPSSGSNPRLPAVVDPTRRLVGVSAGMERVRTLIRRFGPLDVPVLITGETGTGKEVVARALHDCSPSFKLPFVAVNCGAVPLTLLESELFGYERGAFTGATRSHAGYFEQAGSGTLLLDEIGDIAPQLQVALLRVLETGEIRPIGAKAPRKISCRLIAATNADLESRARRGEFRLDLLYRLQRVRIHIPPLRERREDVLSLADHFLDRWRKGTRVTFSPELQALLTHFEWPGNVRELRNVIEQMVLGWPGRAVMGVSELDERLLQIMHRPATVTQGDDSFDDGSLQAPVIASPRPDRASTTAAPVHRDEIPLLLGAESERVEPGRSRLRRLERIRQLFRSHAALTRAELITVLGTSNNTVTSDLKMLCSEGFIQRVEPSNSPRSVYFQLRRPAVAGRQS